MTDRFFLKLYKPNKNQWNTFKITLCPNFWHLHNLNTFSHLGQIIPLQHFDDISCKNFDIRKRINQPLKTSKSISSEL